MLLEIKSVNIHLGSEGRIIDFNTNIILDYLSAPDVFADEIIENLQSVLGIFQELKEQLG